MDITASREYYRKYRKNNDKKLKEYQREYQLKNKENISKRRHEYYLNNKEKYLYDPTKKRKRNKEKEREYRKRYRLLNGESIRAKEYEKRKLPHRKEYTRDYNKKYAITHADSIAKNKADYRKRNKEDIKELQHRYYLLKSEDIKKYQIEYRRKNKEKLSAYWKEYGEKNRGAKRIYSNEWNKRKRLCDLEFRLKGSIRSRIYSALFKGTKSGPTMALIGCSIPELVVHLEKLFSEGMSWDNYGFYGWHIDHVKPLASFDLTDEGQQRLAFHYSNLQPLWAKENLSKGSKII